MLKFQGNLPIGNTALLSLNLKLSRVVLNLVVKFPEFCYVHRPVPYGTGMVWRLVSKDLAVGMTCSHTLHL